MRIISRYIPRPLLRAGITIFCLAYGVGASAQAIDEKINICSTEYPAQEIISKDSLARVLNHLPYPEANGDQLTRHKFGNRRNCKLIGKDMQADLMALLAASEAATNGGLYALSCFRSYESQDEIFCKKIFETGMSIQERALQSAPKGYSEHATGYTLDFGDRKHRKANLEQEFKLTPSGKWLLKNANHFGFENSFGPNNPQGIAYEPWHWRWIGDGKSKASLRARNLFEVAQENFPSHEKITQYANNPFRNIKNPYSDSNINYPPKPSARQKPLSPQFIRDADFARINAQENSNDLWNGLEIRRETFEDDKAIWAIWRIENINRPNGPLWLQLHDNENAAFPALIRGLKAYGGSAVIVDTGADDTGRTARMNSQVKSGRPIDPNRYFSDNSLYTKKILFGLHKKPQMIISLHTNSLGYNGAESDCNKDGPEANGRGVISVLYCDKMMKPYKSKTNHYPFDDNDSIAIIPYRATLNRKTGFCARELMHANFNIGFEKLTKKSDGSFSNYALFRGLRYVNFETLDRGNDKDSLSNASLRATAMINYAMKLCPVNYNLYPNLGLTNFILRGTL